MDVETSPLLQVIGYHQETKHHFFRYARSLGYLDWANQPDPFRRFTGSPLVPLPRPTPEDEPSSPGYHDLYRAGAVRPQPLTLQSVSRFLDHALAITAWKHAGESRWALRSNPSSGNLHPTEGYVLLPAVPELADDAALYHYTSRVHALERRADCPAEVADLLLNPFPPGAFLFGLTSIHWREAWKYGERAFRYCQHDAGHAIGAARIAAATLGWSLLLLENVSDDQLLELLGLNRQQDFAGVEREHPDCVAVVYPDDAGTGSLPLGLDASAIRRLAAAHWPGTANRLSRDEPVAWDIIDVAAAATWKPPTTHGEIARARHAAPSRSQEPDERMMAAQIIRQRRSALAFDGKSTMAASRFYLMLGRTLPHAGLPLLDRPMPWDAVPWQPAIHLGMFVHRVEGIESGLYAFVRDPDALDSLRAAMHRHFAWQRPAGCPDDLPLYLLEAGDARRLAAQVSCHQDIAGDSCFSLGMIADFESRLSADGAWFYRRLFWESGIIGQVLYLEAEAAGLRATGIGCYFDDPVHQVFGLTD